MGDAVTNSTDLAKPQAEKCKCCDYFWDGPNIYWCSRNANIQQITAATEEGCIACGAILEGIEFYGVKRLPDEIVAFTFGDNSAGSKELKARLFANPRLSLSFYRLPDAEIDRSTHLDTWPNGYRVPASTASDESFSWALDRIKDCRTHEECGTETDATLPDRVISISDDDPRKIRLRVAGGDKGSYTCLSHCWGPDPDRVPSTRISNFDQYQVQISWDTLTLKVQEAITFTWSLGIRNIWIDSLCIIQDDHEDWQIQGSKMGSVYSNAFLTISAVYSGGADEGLFSPSSSIPEAHELGVAAGNETSNGSGLFCRPTLSHIVYNDGRFISQEDSQLSMTSMAWRLQGFKFVNTPLARRAWALQERLLSKRILHFGKEELAWECLEHCQCQCSEPLHSGGLAGPVVGANNERIAYSEGRKGELNPKRNYSPAALDKVLVADGALVVCKKWMGLIQEYSSLQLTYKDDVFPALSGIAKAFSKTLEAKYCGGLWEGFILVGLLWRTKSHGIRPPWKAPSWSWASAGKTITYCFIGLEDELVERCQVVDIECTPAGLDPTGRLVTGHTVIRGHAFTAKVKYHEDLKTYPGNLDFAFLHHKVGMAYADYDVTVPGPGHCPEGTTLLFLFIGEHSRYDQHFYLVLKQISRHENEIEMPVMMYERVGMAEVGNTKLDGDDLYATLLKEAVETIVKIV